MEEIILWFHSSDTAHSNRSWQVSHGHPEKWSVSANQRIIFVDPSWVSDGSNHISVLFRINWSFMRFFNTKNSQVRVGLAPRGFHINAANSKKKHHKFCVWIHVRCTSGLLVLSRATNSDNSLSCSTNRSVNNYAALFWNEVVATFIGIRKSPAFLIGMTLLTETTNLKVPASAQL